MENHLTNAYKFDPTQPLYHVSYALFLDRQGRREETVEQFALAIQLSPRVARSAAFDDFAFAHPELKTAILRRAAEGISKEPPSFSAHARLVSIETLMSAPNACREARDLLRDREDLAGLWLTVASCSSESVEQNRLLRKAAILDPEDFGIRMRLAVKEGAMQAPEKRAIISAMLHAQSFAYATSSPAYIRYHVSQSFSQGVLPIRLVPYSQFQGLSAAQCAKLLSSREEFSPPVWGQVIFTISSVCASHNLR